ncbi:hypothetical protein Syun_025788 [Stephania yunnanensis]|uniref:Uncharacterized protein n=1 Tax=Stephania yunnanensis TaxID=152371 RepID=A0AAP0HRL1_9MAGN
MEGTVTNAVRATAPPWTAPIKSRLSSHHLLLFRCFLSSSSSSSSSSLGLLHNPRPLLGFPSRLRPDRCGLRLAATLGSESDPPPPPPPKGLDVPLSKIQDRVLIFFAVLFWMSLFFWACAWDGRSGNRPSKRSRFRR